MRLRDKVVLVTGSSTGIGAAIARRCAREGARVLLHGRDEARLRELAAELGEDAAYQAADLADPDAAQRLVAAGRERAGRLDALVNNAALIRRAGIAETDAALFDRFMAVNVRAPFLLIKAALPLLAEGGGRVLNIGSINGYCGEQALLPYSVSKGALMTLSRNLADTLALRGVGVTHFNVGWVLSENEYRYKIEDGLAEDWPEHVSREFAPSGRLISPEEIAAAAVFWLSEEAGPISGSVIELEQFPVIGRNPPKGGG